MKNIIIFGASHFSTMMYKTITTECEANVLCFTMNKDFITNTELQGLPIHPFENLDAIYNMSECEILITTGYGKMNDVRRHIYEQCKHRGYKIFTSISKHAAVYTQDIGEGCIISAGSHVGPYTKIGCCTFILDAYVSHDSQVGDFCFISAGTTFGGDVTVGDKCFIGMGCTIRNGVSIANKTFVGATSFINENTIEGRGYVGNPATNKNNLKSDLMIRFV